MDGSVTLALVLAGMLVGGLVLERMLLRRRVDAWFLLGFPLSPPLVPIPHQPEGAGRTASVRWEVSERDPALVRFWVEPGSRASLSGLHGAVRLQARRAQVALDVRWAPAWTPMIAAAWLAFLGLARGDGWITLTLGAAMIVGLLALYRGAALRAAAELRWAWVRVDDLTEDTDGEA